MMYTGEKQQIHTCEHSQQMFGIFSLEMASRHRVKFSTIIRGRRGQEVYSVVLFDLYLIRSHPTGFPQLAAVLGK